MKIEISTWLRASLVAIVNRVQGNVKTVRLALVVLDTLDFTPEEREAIGYQERGEVIAWDEAGNDRQWEISLPEASVPLLLQLIQGFEQWPTSRGRQVLDLLAALGWEDEEKTSPAAQGALPSEAPPAARR